MESFTLVFTVFFMLLGPVRLIPTFAHVTRGTDLRFKRQVAIWAALIAFVIAAFVALAGQSFVLKYRISLSALRIAGGLVFLVSAFILMFSRPRAPSPPADRQTPLELAVSPLATVIVPPAGVAAILIFIMLAHVEPMLWLAVSIGLVAVILLDFLAMFFIDTVMGLRGLLLVLQIFGGVLLFLQIALAVQIIINGVTGRGAIGAGPGA